MHGFDGELRPGVENPDLWSPDRSDTTAWKKTRAAVLERDNHTCVYCGHRALTYMHVHHVHGNDSDDHENLSTVCVACHAVLHAGRNLALGTIEIWKAPFQPGGHRDAVVSQVDIVRQTRKLVAQGLTLEEIKSGFKSEYKLREGPFAPDSVDWANLMLAKLAKAEKNFKRNKRFTGIVDGIVVCTKHGDVVPRAWLDDPYVAIFVAFERWQL